MRFALSSAVNPRSLKSYALAQLMAIITSLILAGKQVGKPILIASDLAMESVDEGISLLIQLILATQKTDDKGATSIPALHLPGDDKDKTIPAETVIAALEKMKGSKAKVVVNGNHRNLATALGLAMGLPMPELDYVEIPGDLTECRIAAFKSQAAESLNLRLDFAEQVRFCRSMIATLGTKPTRSQLMSATGLKDGVAQKVLNAACAVEKHGLDIDKCKGMTAQEWQDVRDAKTPTEAKALAYVPEGTDKPAAKEIGVKKAAEAAKDVGQSLRMTALLDAIINNSNAAFVAWIQANRHTLRDETLAEDAEKAVAAEKAALAVINGTTPPAPAKPNGSKAKK